MIPDRNLLLGIHGRPGCQILLKKKIYIYIYIYIYIGNTSFGYEIFLPKQAHKQAHKLRFQILYLRQKMNEYQIAVHL